MHEDIIFFPEQIGSIPFDISMCGTSYCDGSYRIHRPNSPICCIEYVCRGKGYIQVNHVRFTASQGDIYILPMGMDHYYYSDDKDPWEKVWFNIRGDFVSSTIKAYHLENVYHVKGLDLKRYFDDFLCHAASIKNEGHSSQQFDSCAIDFLRIIQGIASAPELQEKPASASKTQQLKQRIDTITDFSQSFDAIISEFYYTKSHLIRAFKAEYGITPYNYLLKHKLNTAKMLLKNTAMSITEIAQQLGFKNCHYFSAFFSQRAGMSPSSYRHSESSLYIDFQNSL